ncbi:hypothetical protein C2E23DRAFT_563426 [Lenzites betulinus]|nr:hypothetical protein C2E23DRAFT_563426 [Lenzites betulinus]
MDTLPTELILRVLSFLPLQSLRNVRLLARRWNAFVVENEFTIYHHAALLHNFVDSIDTLLPEAREARSLQFLHDVPDWYQYCRKYFQLQRNWAGQGRATLKTYKHLYDAHRIKVDEKLGLVITTHELGGLTVYDMATTEVLWRLGSRYVRRYAHCEYEDGFLIFDRVETSKEVWRLETEHDTAGEPSICRPDEAQMSAWRQAASDADIHFPHSAPRGRFRPWALIHSPHSSQAFRFVYPDLLVCGSRQAAVWDVRTGRRTFEVDMVQGDQEQPIGGINYVELNPTHVFICSNSALRVFSRTTKQMVLRIRSYQLVYSDVRLAVQLDPALTRAGVAKPTDLVSLPAAPTQTTILYNASYAEFSSVHVSRDGMDLAAQMSDSRLIVIHDFMRIVRNEVALEAAALELGKNIPRRSGIDEPFSIYLALDHGRCCAVTTSGIYLAILDPTRHRLVDPERAARGVNPNRISRAAIAAGLSFPNVLIGCFPHWSDPNELAKMTCIQMTETKMFFVWDSMYDPGRPRDAGDAGGRGAGAGWGAVPGPGAGEDVHVNAGDEAGAVADEQPVAGPSTGTTAVAATARTPWHPQDFEDENEWEADANEDDQSEQSDDDDDDDDDDDAEPPAAARELVRRTRGPIVFCIDFSPK